MIHDLLEVVRIDCVEYVEEVVSAWVSILWVLVCEVDHKVFILLQLVP